MIRSWKELEEITVEGYVRLSNEYDPLLLPSLRLIRWEGFAANGASNSFSLLFNVLCC
jgi:hypothetical protein